MATWREHPDYPHLVVSDDGRFARIGSPSDNGLGYKRVFFSSERRGRSADRRGAYVHDLVMRTFVGPRPEGAVINHRDGDPRNNDLSNLEYCSVGENLAHRYGLLGHKAVGAKLTPDQVRALRALPKSVTNQQAAEMFGVHWMTAFRARKGKSYAGVV